MNQTRANMKTLIVITSPFFFLVLTTLAASTEPHVIPRHENFNQTDLTSALSDMRRQSYTGFVILLRFLNDTSYFRNTDITFLMPSDNHLSLADIHQENLESFILRHTIPAWLMINHMLHFPNKTLVPCSLSDKMFTITRTGGSGLFVNNARIVAPNICQNSRVSCHGISDVITFNQMAFSRKMWYSAHRLNFSSWRRH